MNFFYSSTFLQPYEICMCPHNANLLLQCALCTAREDLKRRANCTRLTRIPASSNLVRLPRDAAPRRPLGTPVLASSPPARRPQRGVGYVGEPVGARGSHGTQRLPDETTRVLAGCVRAQVKVQVRAREALDRKRRGR